MTTNLDTKALRALEAAATKAPWHPDPIYWALRMAEKGGCGHINDDLPDDALYPTYHGEDVPLIVALRNAAPALLDAAEERDKLKAEVAWRQEAHDTLFKTASEIQAERDALRSEVERLREALDGMLGQFECVAPDAHCSCHVSPPCNDCVEWAGAREAVENARAALSSEKGEVQS